MTGTAFALLILYGALVARMSARADRRFRHHTKLPMQWGLNRQPTWYAPRAVALTVTPVLAGIAFLLVALSVAAGPGPFNGSDDPALAWLLGWGAFGIAVYAGYLWLVGRWDRALSAIAD